MKSISALAAYVALFNSVVYATSEVKQVAVIGAGPAGSSAAYHLRKFADEAGIAVNITVFEKTDRIGGRTLTVNAWNSSSLPIELGASLFVESNKIMYAAVPEFGLTFQDPDISDVPGSTVIWNGKDIVFNEPEDGFSWSDYAKFLLRYGTGPTKFTSLVSSQIAKFIKIYDSPVFPFSSLTDAVKNLDLLGDTSINGRKYLQQNGINTNYANEVIQAATRANYAANLDYIHGLETVVSMATSGATQVAGGNWQIFEEMVLRSNATLYKNTAISGIDLTSKKSGKYTVKPATKLAHSTCLNAFDDVIVANPFQFSGITIPKSIFDTKTTEIPYMRLHVTIFATPRNLSSSYFNINGDAPTTVLTSLAPGDVSKEGTQGAGSAGFYSVNALRQAVNPTTGETEIIWKIFSPEVVTSKFLSDLFGTKIPNTFTGKNSPISWYHPDVFWSYPIELPRTQFQSPQIHDGLWYTSGMEAFISTMETNALMGMNVAQLIVNGYTSKANETATKTKEEGNFNAGKKH